MKLFTYCNSWKEEIPIKSHASTKPGTGHGHGGKFTVNCIHCAINQEKQVNDVRAKENRTLLFAGIIISCIVTIALWNMGLIAAISFAIPVLIWQK